MAITIPRNKCDVTILVLLSNQQAKDSSFTLIQDKGKQKILLIKKLEPLNIFA